MPVAAPAPVGRFTILLVGCPSQEFLALVLDFWPEREGDLPLLPICGKPLRSSFGRPKLGSVRTPRIG